MVGARQSWCFRPRRSAVFVSENLFRQKSLEHISSPEEMHNYMRVTSPRLWMILAAISLLLVGFIIYASFAKIENTIPTTVHVEVENPTIYDEDDGPMVIAYGTLPNSYKNQLEVGMEVRLDDLTGTIEWFSATGEELGFLIDFGDDADSLTEGEYEAEIVIESISPISFLLN